MKNISTDLIHAGEPHPKVGGAISLPIFQSANFEFVEESRYENIKYARLNNTPNHLALHQKLSAIEGGEAALVTGSGMAAISTTLLSLLSPGDHVLAQKTLYGATFAFLTQDLKRFGIEVDLVDPLNPSEWTKKIRKSTKVFYVETISNPLMEIPAFKEIADFCKSNSLTSITDNTFASPYNFQPLKFGFDLSLHSATKYLNGHSDVVAGAVIGKGNLLEKINHMAVHLGGMLDPHACFLLHRGIKTLAVRLERQNQSALQIAHFLNDHDQITNVNYPGLSTHPGHARAKEYFRGFGGMMSFEVKGDSSRTEKFLRALKIPLVAASLGGVESLVIRPAQSSHLILSPLERKAAGISDQLVRFSVGLEDVDDLIADFKQALTI